VDRVLETTRIDEVKERVTDFSAALRAAGAPELAQRMDGYAARFVDGSEVRRSVDAIKQQLQHYRKHPDELPNLPVVLIAANRLEDACKDALRAGVIEPARPSLRAAGKRKLSVITTTLSAGTLLLLVPFLVTLGGVDLTDLGRTRSMAPLSLVQGEDASASVSVLSESLDPPATRGVEFYVAGHCPHDLPGGLSCRPAGERYFGSDKLEAYELMLDGQA
jgi:hypothetical protein